MISKLVALLLAVVYIIAAGVSSEGWPFAGTVALGVLLALALIWFPNEIDSWEPDVEGRSTRAPHLALALVDARGDGLGVPGGPAAVRLFAPIVELARLKRRSTPSLSPHMRIDRPH